MKRYNERFDAYYETDTNEWLESKCDDPECDYCSGRPDHPPPFEAGDTVMVIPYNRKAIVVEQYLSYDYPDVFWGNVKVNYEDGVQGTCNNWQLKIIEYANS